MSPLENLSLRDPDSFRAGEFHAYQELWNKISAGYVKEVEVNEWTSKGIDITAFCRPFKGVFKGVEYECPTPPRKTFKNHPSCKQFRNFISETLSQRLKTGAVVVWGKVGEVQPPHLVLPITVEPSKPRLCIDARFLNLWMKDTPFSLDKLIDVPRFVYKSSFMSKIDDKSGYDHILLTKESSQYFGIEWNGLWWVCTTLPFGWKNFPYVYQTIGLVASNFFRQKGIACSLYIDDRLDGELFTKKGFWSRPIGQRDTGYSYKSAEAALYIVCKVLTRLGYFLGLKKCVLAPAQRILYLGMLIDSEEKKERFASLREGILIRKSSIPLKSLQRSMGKCISFSLAFPGAKFYIREMAQAVGRASPKGEIQLTAGLREELELWRFLDEWNKHIPWKDEKHWVLSVSTDASLSRWAGVIHCQRGTWGLPGNSI